MEVPDGHFRHISLYYFRKGKNAVQARFRSGDFDRKDAPRSGRPTEVDDDKIKAMIEHNRCSTTREIAEMLNISQMR